MLLKHIINTHVQNHKARLNHTKQILQQHSINMTRYAQLLTLAQLGLPADGVNSKMSETLCPAWLESFSVASICYERVHQTANGYIKRQFMYMYVSVWPLADDFRANMWHHESKGPYTTVHIDFLLFSWPSPCQLQTVLDLHCDVTEGWNPQVPHGCADAQIAQMLSHWTQMSSGTHIWRWSHPAQSRASEPLST